MSFIRTSFYSGIGTAVSLAMRLITNKVMAVYLSTDGMFLLGQLRDFLRITNVAGHAGTIDGTISQTAKYKEEDKEQKRIWGTAFITHLICSGLVMLIVVLFNSQISTYLFKTDIYGTIVAIIGISSVAASLQILVMSILNGLKRIKLYVTVQIITSVLSSAIVIALILKFLVKGALLAFAISQFLGLAIGIGAILIAKPFRLSDLLCGWDREALNKLLKYSIMAIAGPVFLVIATFFVRSFLAAEFDQQHAGSWEGMWRLSAMYLLFLTATFKFHLIPTFSELEGAGLRKEVFKVWSFILPIVVVMSIILYLLRDFVINLFLAKDFYLIGTLIGFHLLGDIIKINSWVLGNILIAKAKTRVFVAFQLEWALVFSVLTLILCRKYGFVGVSMAYFGAYVLHFGLMNLFFRKLIWKTRSS